MRASAAALIGFMGAAFAAHAAPVYTTSTTIAQDPTAPESNFDTPSKTNKFTAYQVRTGQDATNFYVDVTELSPPDTTSNQFANIYIGGPTFSGIIIEATNHRVSTYDAPGTYTELNGTGYSFTATPGDIAFALPFAFLETDPLQVGFSKVSPGDLIRVSYSQSFGYSFVGGGDQFPDVNRLGGQIVPAASAVPEPASLTLLGMGLIGLGLRRRRGA